MEKVLSISIAAYNADWCLNNCIDSLLNESINKDIEIIVVNDGSKDNTLSIAEQYRDMFPDTITIINKQNGGHGSTLNSAIEEARGKYFKAVDADDQVDTIEFINLVRKLKSIDVDLILSPYYQIDVQTKQEEIKEYWRKEGDYKKYCYQEMELSDELYPLRFAMHAITYKTSILRNSSYRMDENCFYVDVEYALQYLDNINRIYLTDKPIYKYYVGFKSQSVEFSNMLKRYKQLNTVNNSLLGYYSSQREKLNDNQEKIFCWNYVNMFVFPYYDVLLQLSNTSESKQLFIQTERRMKLLSKSLYDQVVFESKKNRPRLRKIILVLRKTHYFAYSMINYITKQNRKNKKEK